MDQADHRGCAALGQPLGAPQFGSAFFMITGFHGTHVTIGVIFLILMARKVWRGDLETQKRGFFTSRRGNYEIVEITGLYWHFVDLVWVFIFACSICGEGGAMAHAAHAHDDDTHKPTAHAQGQQHPIKLYLWSGAGCSSSAPAPTWSIISACRAICAGP